MLLLIAALTVHVCQANCCLKLASFAVVRSISGGGGQRPIASPAPAAAPMASTGGSGFSALNRQRQHSPDDSQAKQLRDEIMTLRNTLAAETRFKMDLMHELGKSRREVEHLQQQLAERA